MMSHSPTAPCFRDTTRPGETNGHNGGGAAPIRRSSIFAGGSLVLCLYRLGVCGGFFGLLVNGQTATRSQEETSPKTKNRIEAENLQLLALGLRSRQDVMLGGGAGSAGNITSMGGNRHGIQQGKTSLYSISRSLKEGASPDDSKAENSDTNAKGAVKFMLDGKVEIQMAGDAMRRYLNRLVDTTVADTENQTCNIAFVKTHKTASTTLATILYRYGKRHGLNVANFHGHQSSINLPEAARKVQETGNPVDVMHYHHAWDGFYEGGWSEAKAAYLKIMRDPSNIKLVTAVREPVSHYLSYYYYFLQPEIGISITEYFELSKKPKDPRYERIFLRTRNGNTGWHGFKLLQNPLCAEFGIQNVLELESFLQNDLPEFAMIILTEYFEESLAIFMRMFKWHPIDMTFCRVIETRAGLTRYDGKMLANVPRVKDLPSKVINAIRRQTKLDLALYKAAVRIYKQYKLLFEENLEVDIQRIRTAQSAVHGYLDFNATSLAHDWYEGDVKCFADPSPTQPF